ncbi:hypothetical protein VNO77_02359 [Canavalia gladiata]|uniref:Uncharacterized protein n=1 Tax=Canavalia gladiata TaxID=3824 RepID=A0AAN9MUX4_CANGL
MGKRKRRVERKREGGYSLESSGRGASREKRLGIREDPKNFLDKKEKSRLRREGEGSRDDALSFRRAKRIALWSQVGLCMRWSGHEAMHASYNSSSFEVQPPKPTNPYSKESLQPKFV